MKEDLIAIIKAKFSKNGYAFIRTRKLKPFGLTGIKPFANMALYGKK